MISASMSRPGRARQRAGAAHDRVAQLGRHVARARRPRRARAAPTAPARAARGRLAAVPRARAAALATARDVGARAIASSGIQRGPGRAALGSREHALAARARARRSPRAAPSADDRHDRHAELAREAPRRRRAWPRVLEHVDHVERDDQRQVELEHLQHQVEVARELRGVDDEHDGVGALEGRQAGDRPGSRSAPRALRAERLYVPGTSMSSIRPWPASSSAPTVRARP